MIQHHVKIDAYITFAEVDTSVWYIMEYAGKYPYSLFPPLISPVISPRFRLVGSFSEA